MTLVDYNSLNYDLSQFLLENQNKLPVIQPWYQGNCCLFPEGTGTTAMGMSFPVSSSFLLIYYNGLCVNNNVTAQYGNIVLTSGATFTLSTSAIWISTYVGCAKNHNPGIYRYQISTVPTTKLVTTPVPPSYNDYGIYDSFDENTVRPLGWTLLHASDYEALTNDLMDFLSLNQQNLPVIKSWTQNNCCLFHGTNTAMGTSSPTLIPYLYIAYRGSCLNGVVSETHGYLVSGINPSQRFIIYPNVVWISNSTACSSNHNPGIYRKSKHLPSTTTPTFRKFVEVEDHHTQIIDKCFPTIIEGINQCNLTNTNQGYTLIQIFQKTRFQNYFRIINVAFNHFGPNLETIYSFSATQDTYGNILGFGQFDTQQDEKSCNYYYTAVYNQTRI